MLKNSLNMSEDGIVKSNKYFLYKCDANEAK